MTQLRTDVCHERGREFYGPAIDYLRIALRRLDYRGYDSVGVAVQTTAGDVAHLRTVGRIGALDRLVREWAGPQFGGVGIGHTRWATHGAVTEANAHPHIDCTGQISLVHNGIIENAVSLRDALTGAGHRFATSVDSEVLCHLIEDQRQRCGDLFEAVQNALTRAEGSWGLAVLEQGTGQIVVAAHGSPLLVARTAHGDFATSDIAAVADWADSFRVLEDGDVDLTCSSRWSHRGTAAAPPATTRCTWHGRDAELNGYTDYTAKEIDEQPEAAARVLDELGDGIANGTPGWAHPSIYSVIEGRRSGSHTWACVADSSRAFPAAPPFQDAFNDGKHHHPATDPQGTDPVRTDSQPRLSD